MKAVCPQCGRTIPMEDINIAADRAMCRQCNELFELQDLAESSDEVIPLDSPPRGVRLEDYGGMSSVVVSLRRPMAIFLIIFTLIWGGGSMSMAVGMFISEGFKLELLFFLPFLLGTLVLISITSLLLFGRSRADWLDGFLTLSTGVGPIVYRRMIDAGEIDRIWMAFGSMHVNNQPVEEIFIGRTQDQKPLKFGMMMKDDHRNYVFGWLRAHFRRHRGGGHAPRSMANML